MSRTVLSRCRYSRKMKQHESACKKSKQVNKLLKKERHVYSTDRSHVCDTLNLFTSPR